MRRIGFAELPQTIPGEIRRVELREREADLAARDQVAEHEQREEHFPDLRETIGGAGA
ncbi:hypothetical protein [Microbacterium testaceum]|uniref:hypothetical protein n=1 Tax=Microbacterium testaceum TaxID=2033 RepID=UPI00187C08D2